MIFIKVYKYEVGERIFVNSKAKKGMPSYVGREGIICEQIEDSGQFDYIVEFNSSNFGKFREVELTDDMQSINQAEDEVSIAKFTKLGNEIGEFTDSKNKQYGSSVDATLKMIKVLMERYKSNNDTYVIPESLLQHILLQVRMMDKQNRIFNNPSGEGDSESPYKDLTGYSLIGIDMVERLNK